MFNKMIKEFKGIKRDSESGNVLFLILIAVALFAALSYAVTQSSRTGGGATDGESNLVNSAQITQYPASVRTAIVRMLIGGVDATQLEFDPPADFASLTQDNFGVFHPSGGGATSVTAPATVMADGAQGEWLFNSRYQITNIGTTAANNSANDIIAFLPGVNTSICERINQELGITGGTDTDTNGVPTSATVVANVPTVAMNQDGGTTGIGAYAATHVIAGAFTGQPFGCADFDDATAGTAADTLIYYHVLVER